MKCYYCTGLIVLLHGYERFIGYTLADETILMEYWPGNLCAETKNEDEKHAWKPTMPGQQSGWKMSRNETEKKKNKNNRLKEKLFDLGRVQ